MQRGRISKKKDDSKKLGLFRLFLRTASLITKQENEQVTIFTKQEKHNDRCTFYEIFPSAVSYGKQY
jgi:hypothetical protein